MITVSRACLMALSGLLLGGLDDSARAQDFTDIAEEAGIEYQHHGFMYVGGIAVADFDDDGFQDIYMTTGEGHPNLLYLNGRDGTFSEQAETSRVADMSAGWGAVSGDLDNDGDADIYLTNYFSQNQLFLNDGNGRFVVAVESGTSDAGPSTSAALADYNNDGHLDIYVLNRSQATDDYADALLLSNGDGTFADVTAASGTGNMGTSLAVSSFDYDGDGYQDIYVANEFELDALYNNSGDGTFVNRAAELGLPHGAGMGVDFSDYDNDGDLDAYVTNLKRDFLLQNNGDGTFTDRQDVGILNDTMAWGVNFLDYDNDGDEDLYVTNGGMIWPEQYSEDNVFYVNNGDGTFTEVANRMGMADDGDGRASVCADFNNDGYMDIFMINVVRGRARLFRNNNWANNWLTVRLVGTTSNRSGIGAIVAIKAGTSTQIREVNAGASYASMHSINQQFGLLKNSLVDKVTVRWPSGIVQELTDVEVNQTLIITEPLLTAVAQEETPPMPATFRLSQNYPNPFNPATSIEFVIPESGSVSLVIYDLKGSQVTRLESGWHDAGRHVAHWDASGIASGVYVYRLEAGTFTQTRKMALLK